MAGEVFLAMIYLESREPMIFFKKCKRHYADRTRRKTHKDKMHLGRKLVKERLTSGARRRLEGRGSMAYKFMKRVKRRGMQQSALL
jgi:hypothetical protein